MIPFHKVLETFSKYAFCTEIHDKEDDDDRKKKNWLLYFLSTLFELIDIINLILDLIFVFTKLINDKEHLGKGITMLIGLTLARIVARRGHILKEKGGLARWAPFCRRRNPEQYNADEGNKERHLTLSILYCITFTELAIFFLEDATMILIWLTTAEFDPSDKWDLLNSWMTILSAVTTMSLLILSMVYSTMECQSFIRKTQSRLNRSGSSCWRKLFVMIQITLEVVIQTIGAMLYMLCFLIIIIGYFIFLLWLCIRVIHLGLEDPIRLQRFFYVLVFFSWAIASYFIITLFLSRTTTPKQQQQQPPPPNNSNCHSSNHSILHSTSSSFICDEESVHSLQKNSHESTDNNSSQSNYDGEERMISSDQHSSYSSSNSIHNNSSSRHRMEPISIQLDEEINDKKSDHNNDKLTRTETMGRTIVRESEIDLFDPTGKHSMKILEIHYSDGTIDIQKHPFQSLGATGSKKETLIPPEMNIIPSLNNDTSSTTNRTKMVSQNSNDNNIQIANEPECHVGTERGKEHYENNPDRSLGTTGSKKETLIPPEMNIIPSLDNDTSSTANCTKIVAQNSNDNNIQIANEPECHVGMEKKNDLCENPDRNLDTSGSKKETLIPPEMNIIPSLNNNTSSTTNCTKMVVQNSDDNNIQIANEPECHVGTERGKEHCENLDNISKLG